MNAGKRCFCLSLLFLVLFPNDAARLSLDPSGVQDLENQMKLYTYNILSHLDHLATSKFKLRLNPKASERMDFLQNVTKAGISYGGITAVPDFAFRSEEAFKRLESTLSEESLFLLRALSKKNLRIPLALTPSDETLPEAINFMDAFKQFWTDVDKVASFEVEHFDPRRIPKFLQESVSNRTRKLGGSLKRSGRKFLVPELPFQVSEEFLRTLLSEVFVKPRYHDDSILEKTIIRTFITQTFDMFGLQVYNHEFSAHETHFLFGKQILGTNIIGILPGERWGTSQDMPMIIGAHYDTVANTTGSIDNASGTSAVIEIARMLTSSKCKFKNSIFFVAFDLEEIGTQGSFMFVKDFLLKLIFPSYGINSIGGALILDCIGNWNTTSGTQEVPNAWEEKVTGLKMKIQKTNNTGDFLAVMYRENPDNLLAERMKHYYNGLGDPEYRLEMMSLRELHKARPNDSVNLENFDFFRSDHYRFWYPSKETPNVSFPALLLTDTGPYRGKMKNCYHAPCDTMESMNPSIGFIAKVTQAAAWVTADLAMGTCGPKGLFQIPELFQVSEERQRIEHGTTEEDGRPAVTMEGIMEILNFLGRTNIQNLDKSPLDGIKSPNANGSSLLKAPVHRFRVLPNFRNKFRKQRRRNPLRKVTIAIHGRNSTFLIPLRLFSQPKPHGLKRLQSQKNETSHRRKESSKADSVLDKNYTVLA